MVTGMEQYHFERAGYFVRRALVVAGGGDGSTPPSEVVALAGDVLGQPIRELHPEQDAVDLIWRRATGPPADAAHDQQEAALARCTHVVEVRLALSPVDVYVLPGTHVAPLSRETLHALARTAVDQVAEAVRVRLAAGDCLVMSAALLRADDEASPHRFSTWLFARG